MIVLDSGKDRLLTSVGFSHDGAWVAGTGPGAHTVVWETATGRAVRRFRFRLDRVNQSLVFHPRASRLYVATSAGLHDIDLAGTVARNLWPSREYTGCLTVDPAGRWLVAYHSRQVEDEDELTYLYLLSRIDITDPDRPTLLWERPAVDPPGYGWSEALAFLPNGERLISVEATFTEERCEGLRLGVRRADTGDVLHRDGGSLTVRDPLVVSPRGDRMATALGTMLSVLDPRDFSLLPVVLTNDSTKHFTSIAFHPSGRFLAATSNDATVKLYDTTSWEVAKTYTWDIGKMRSIAFSPDGTLAAAGSDTGKVVVWDVDV